MLFVDKTDLVSYRGPRSMIMVDMSVDVSTECRSSNGRVSVEHRPLYYSLIRNRSKLFPGNTNIEN